MDPQIHRWQKTIPSNQSSEDVVTIAKVFSNCSGLWGLIVHILTEQHRVDKSTIRKLQSAHSYLRLWADGYGVVNGRFEERLKNSQRAGDMTIRLLQNTCRILAEGAYTDIACLKLFQNNDELELTPIVIKISKTTSRDATSLSLAAADLALSSERLAALVQGDNDSEASERREQVTPSKSPSIEELLDNVAEDLRNDTQCLLDLGDRFEEQVMNPIASEAAADPLNLFDGGLSDTFIERIIHFYPRCESNLAGRIGKANWLQFVRITYLKSRTGDGQTIPDRDTDITHDSTESELIESGSVVGVASILEKSLFNDSGLGTASRVSENHPSAIQTALGNQGYPPLPERAARGEPFRCMACKKQVKMVTENEWREHLLRDIEPYVCPEDDCNAPLFANTFQWEMHMDICHPHSTIWNDSKCRICGEAVSDKAMVMRHLVDHMEVIALTILPRGPDTEVGKVPAQNADEEGTRETADVKQGYVRPRKPKVKTGCNMCKMRRIKCDEKRPACTQCIRSKKNCEGYPPPQRLLEVKGDSKFDEPSLLPGQHESGMEEKLPVGSGSSGLLVDHDSYLSWNDETATDYLGVDYTNSLYPSGSEKPNSTGSDTTHPIQQFGSAPTQIVHPTQVIPPSRRHKPLPPIIVNDPYDTTAMKRARNTLAARKSRERRAQRLDELEEKIADLEREREHWKKIAMNREADRS